MGLLSGKIGVIFGVVNEKSIAFGIAKRFIEEGARVIFSYHPGVEQRFFRTVEGLGVERALCFPCDVSNDEEVASGIRLMADAAGQGGFDFIVHSVAYADHNYLGGDFCRIPKEKYLEAMAVSAYSLVAIAREARLLPKKPNSIVTLSYLGSERVVTGYNVMGVAKAALECGARYLASDLGPEGTRVNVISAGSIKTLSSSVIAGFGQMQKASAGIAPLQRNITQDDVAKTALYLASDLSSGVTGEIIHVDCGFHMIGAAKSD